MTSALFDTAATKAVTLDITELFIVLAYPTQPFIIWHCRLCGAVGDGPPGWAVVLARMVDHLATEHGATPGS
jgi:hypothetical protein